MTDSALFDLTWLCTEYQSAIGIKSSGSTFEQLALGIHVFGGGGHEISARALAASAKAGRIINAMARMGKQDRNVLIHSYDPLPRMPLKFIANYGDALAGIAWKIRAPKSVVGQTAIKQWAQLRLDRAHGEYLKQKRGLDE